MKPISPAVVFMGDILTMKDKYTDLEEDINTVLVVYKWYNGAVVAKNDTFRYPFSTPDVPVKHNKQILM